MRSPSPDSRLSLFRFLLVSLSTLCLLASASHAASPWLDEAGSFSVTPILIYESFDEFYKGSDRTAFPFENFEQITSIVSLDYVPMDRVGLDFTFGYVHASGDAGLKSNDGLQDINLGIRYQVLDEFDWEQSWVPSMTVRVGSLRISTAPGFTHQTAKAAAVAVAT